MASLVSHYTTSDAYGGRLVFSDLIQYCGCHRIALELAVDFYETVVKVVCRQRTTPMTHKTNELVYHRISLLVTYQSIYEIALWYYVSAVRFQMCCLIRSKQIAVKYSRKLLVVSYHRSMQLSVMR